MIFGECPYCNEPVQNSIADKCPAFERVPCEHCGKTYWLRHSRLDPVAYTLENFEKEFEVDEATKQIKQRESA